MQDRDGWIWYDGKFVPWRQATTHVLTHSLHYGLTVIEGIRAYSGPDAAARVFRLDAHVRRFVDSAKAYRMPLPYSVPELESAHLSVLIKNELTSAYLRPIAFYGPEKMGVSPRGAQVHVAIAAFPWQSTLREGAAERGIRVKTSSFACYATNTALSRAKVAANYTNSLLAIQEAHEDGYDDALRLDTAGFVAEGSGANLFLVSSGRLLEPEPTSALLGITRDSVRQLAKDMGIETEVRRLTRDDVYLADEAFFTGTAAEVVPIVELDRRQIGGGEPGPITRALRTAYLSAVSGHDERYAHWLKRAA